MQTIRFPRLLTAAIALAALATAGGAENEKVTAAPPAVAANTPVAAPVSPVAAVSAATWADIKDLTYEARAQFMAGQKRLEARVDEQIAELTARRAVMDGTTDTKDWDFAMKEMGDARSYFKSMGEELAKAGRETWNQQKDKVGIAWVRTQDAYGKVKASTTS